MESMAFKKTTRTKGWLMKSTVKTGCAYLLAFLLWVAPSAWAVSISGDMVTQEDGKTKTAKFYMRDNQYRMDVEEDGKKGRILVDRQSGKTRVVIPDEKVYMEMNNNDIRVLLSNPIEGYEMMRDKYEHRSGGIETIDGIECDKIIFHSAGKDLVTAWIAKPYAFPIRLENHGNDYRYDLKNITETHIDEAEFQVPAGYEKKEDLEPEKKKKKAEPIVAITDKQTFEAPIGRRIGAGGALRVTVDPQMEISLFLSNQNQGESSAAITALKNNAPISLPYPEEQSIHFEKLWDKKEIDLRDLPNPDAIEIKVTNGLVYAQVEQGSRMGATDQVRKEFLRYPIDWEFLTRPGLKIDFRLVGSSQDVSENKLKMTFFKDEYKTPVQSEEFSLQNGQSKQWQFDAGQIGSGKVELLKGDVQFILYQTTDGAKSKTAAAKAVQKSEPAPKPVTTFAVNHPYGTSKPLTPGKDLTVMVTGMSAKASGTIDLYTDRQKTQKIDSLTFKLKRKQSQSFPVPGEKNVGWATVRVHDGSFKVTLDQASPIEAAAPVPPKVETATAMPPAPAAPPAASGMILNGEVPLMEGATVLKEMVMGNSGRFDLEVPASPEEVVAFYKQAMTAKGWQPGMAMSQGPVAVLQLKKGKGQIMIKAVGKGAKSTVNMAVMSQ
jgi:hypothetical protein